MSSQVSPFPSKGHQSFILEIMESERRPRNEEQRDPGRLASIFAKIPSIPRFGPASQTLHKQRPHSMTIKMSKNGMVNKTGHDQSKQNEVNDFRSKGKQKSVLANENSNAGPSESYENHIESNGHKPTTRQGVEPVAAEHPSHSEEAAASATCDYVSTVSLTSEAAASATAVPPVAEKISRPHVKKMADDCYVDLARSLSSDTQLAWDTKINPWLNTNLLHSLDDFNCISAECVMAGIEDGGSMDPTILFMCRDLAQKQSIGKLLDRCPFIPRNLRRRIIVFDILKCTSGKLGANRPTERFQGREIVVYFDDAHNAHILYANVARTIPVARGEPSIFCTIGGMLTVNGKFYGLTTAHPLASLSDEGQAEPILDPALSVLGRVAYAQWPNSAQGEDNRVKSINTTYSRGEDWALVEFSHPAITCNTFRVPGAEKPQKVTGHVKTTELGSGEVWVCAGVSGVQLGFLKHHPASIMISESLFGVRSISLERPLVDGDSGSWVVQDEKLCGFIFCRTGNGLEWAYMLPIEAVLDSISEYWKYLHPGLPRPDVQVAGDEVVDPATKAHEIMPKPEDKPEPSVSETRRRELSELRSNDHSPQLPLGLGILENRDINTLSTIASVRRRNSDLSDDTRRSATFEETIAWDRKAVLSLDGGGVRGYSTLLIIQEIMKAIAHREKSHLDGPARSSYHPFEPPEAEIWLPCHYFDYVSGIGTGGLSAIMLGRLRMDIQDSILASDAVLKEVSHGKRWFHSRSCLFWPRAKFDHLILEQMIQKLVRRHAPRIQGFPGSSCFASDENQCRTVVVAFKKQKQEHLRIPDLFRTFKSVHGSADPLSHELRLHQNLSLAHHIPIWQVARATTAAPTFFQPVIIDGLEYTGAGFAMNNARVEAEIYDEVENIHGNRHDSIILSIGSGLNNVPSSDRGIWHLTYRQSKSEQIHQKTASTPEYYRLDVEEGLGQIKMDEWRARGRVRTSIGSLIGRHRTGHSGNLTRIKLEPLRQDQQLFLANSDHTVVEQTHPEIPREPNRKSAKQAAHQDQGSQDVMVSPKGNSSGPIAVDNKSKIPRWFQPKDHTKESICRYTREYLDREDVQSKINKIAKILVEKRRERVKSDPERWERFCFGTWYQCDIHKCPRAGKEYGSRSALQAHLLDKHGDQFSRRDPAALEAALDRGRFRVFWKHKPIPPFERGRGDLTLG